MLFGEEACPPLCYYTKDLARYKQASCNPLWPCNQQKGYLNRHDLGGQAHTALLLRIRTEYVFLLCAVSELKCGCTVCATNQAWRAERGSERISAFRESDASSELNKA